MISLVVDSRVAIKWFVEEPGTHEARSLARYQLHAPDLLVAECANVLWKKVRLKELTREQAETAAELLERSEIELEPMRRLLKSATAIAVLLDQPAYDCFYLALGRALSCPVVTADLRMQQHARRQGFDVSVMSPSQASKLGRTGDR